MTTLRERINHLAQLVWRSFNESCVPLIALSVATGCLSIGTTTLAQSISLATPGPSRVHAPRVVVPVGGTRDVAFDEPVAWVTVVDPEFVTAELKSATLMRLTALKEGETMVIVTGRSLRRTYAVEVRPRPAETTELLAARAARQQREMFRPSGVYTVSFSPSFGNAPALLRQSFDYSRKMAGGRTLRVSADTFKFLGSGERGLVTQTGPSLGLNRLTLGLDTHAAKFDLLDSELNISPITLNGYTMRGVHFVSAADSRLRGLEFFAGLARPSLTLFDNNEGYLGGAILPIARSKTWQLRAGILATVSRRDATNRESGIIWHVDGRYTPDERTTVTGEANFANSVLSWRGQLNLQRGPFNVSGESLRFDRRMPLVGLGAQSGGRKLNAFSVGWQPSARFIAIASYSHAANLLLSGARRAELNYSNLFASVSYNLTPNSRLSLRYSQQSVETTAQGLSTPLRLDTRSASIAHSARFGGGWSNDFEAGLTATREPSAGTQFERGVNLHDELRRTWSRWSAASYLDYTRHTPSLTSLIVRNPDLLPPALRRAYEADPVRFLILNRGLIPALLGGVALPETRNLDVGLRLQGAFSRYTMASEVRYNTGEIFGREQHNLLAIFSMSVRLDAANSVQLSTARSFALNSAGGQSALSISYVHRFGAGGGGFQFSRLFGLGRGHIAGRVFFDLNSDGHDDPEEPGVAGMKIQLDRGHSVTTDERGRFRFSSLNPDEYDVALISDDLGVGLRASTTTEQHVSLSARRTVSISFGLTNYGSVAGRIFNDLLLKGEQTAGNAPGVAGVRVSLRPASAVGAPFTLTVDASGVYQFRNLAPGSYTLEIDSMTLPADFRLPRQTSWPLTVEPLQNYYLDIPLAAQRAIAGVVFIDKDGNGKFDPEKDEPIEGARVITGQTEVTTRQTGAYILRGLPAGRIEVRARTSWGVESRPVTIELRAEPMTQQAVNLVVTR